MTSVNNQQARNRDVQDLAELHVWGSVEYIDAAGSVINVRGTDTQDIDVPVLNTGAGHNLPTDSNCEVLLISTGSDTNRKFALLTIPRDVQRQWAERTGGVQSPTSPDKALEFNDRRTHLTEDNVAAGSGGMLEVTATGVVIRGDLQVDGNLNVQGGINAGGTIGAVGAVRSNAGMIAPGFTVGPGGVTVTVTFGAFTP